MKAFPLRHGRPFALASFVTTLLASLIGCEPSTPATPPQPVAKAEPVKPGPARALTLPARAIANQRSAAFIANVDGKRLYSVSGERWLIDSRGKVELESAPFNEKLDAVIGVSQGAVKAIGWSRGRLFAFDNILGLPRLSAESDSSFVHVRPGPSSILLFSYWGAAAIDAITFAEKSSVFPSFPTKDAVFVNDQRGVALTLVGGIGTTTDGGKTWKPLRHKVTASVPNALYWDGEAVFLKESYTNRGAPVDIATSTLGDPTDIPISKPFPTSSLERWITANGNPVLSAVRNGIFDGKDGGFVAANGVVARVSLATGAFTEEAKYEGSVGECRGGASGKEAYLVCPISDKKGSSSRLFRVQTEGNLSLTAVKEATFGGSVVPDLMVSPSGGILAMQGCVDKWGGICVRQSDGSFKQMDTQIVAYPSAMTPLADGRVLSVGVRRDDKSSVLEISASTPRERKVLDEMVFEKDVTIRVAKPEQGADGEVRFVVTESQKNKQELFLYAFDPAKKGFDKTLIAEAMQANFSDGVLLVKSKGDVPYRVSHDYGMTFRDLTMPKGVSASFSTVNRLGFIATSHARVGWEPLPEAPPPQRLSPSFRLKSPPVVSRVSTDVTCKTSATGRTGVQLVRYTSDASAVFDLKPAPKGTKRVISQFASSPLETTAVLAIEAPEPVSSKLPTAPVTAQRWTLRWVDDRDLDAKVKTVSGKAPLPEMYSYLRNAFAKDGRLFLSASIGSKNVLVRTKGTGFETAIVPSVLIPSPGGPVGISADGNWIAYLAGEMLVAWKSGEAPLPVAMVNQRSGVLLGAPTKDGIAVLAVADPTSYYRVFPLPVKSDEPIEKQWISAAWDGWSRGPAFAATATMPLCDAKAVGAAFRSTSYGPSISMRFGIDGASPRSTRSQRYDIVTDGKSACLDGVMAELWDRANVVVKNGATSKTVSLDVVRFSGKGKKGELTLSGRTSEKVPLYSMTCEANATK